MDNTSLDLLAPPHIVDKLLQLEVGEWQPDHSQRKLLISHLIECPYCRTAPIVLLAAEPVYERSNCSPETTAHDLLTRFVTVLNEIEAREPEYMGAYAEAIVFEGREGADNRFPILAEHIRKCQSCKSTLEETLTFLKEFKEII
jgi:hypothetical protein